MEIFLFKVVTYGNSVPTLTTNFGLQPKSKVFPKKEKIKLSCFEPERFF
jgi:hypothetical protein